MTFTELSSDVLETIRRDDVRVQVRGGTPQLPGSHGSGSVRNVSALRITGLCYRGFWMCIAGVWDLQTTSFEIP